MRLYNATDRHLNLPLTSTARLSIAGHSVSGDFMPNDNFLRLLPSLYDETEMAVIIAGTFEMNAVANFPALSPMVCQSIDEAIQRFAIPEPAAPEVVVVEEEPAEEEPVAETADEETTSTPAIEEEVAEENKEVAEEPAATEEPAKPVFTKKKKNRK